MPGSPVAMSADIFTTVPRTLILRRTALPMRGWKLLLPGIGWVGFDPTVDRLASEQHIRTAIGRDYADVPPTMGMMKGKADTLLQVRVRVTPSEAVLPPDEEFAADEEWSQFLDETQQSPLAEAQQQQ